MFIAEIFHSIQGEGELTGVPSTFVRTSGCNLRCTWCDTKYASWQPEGEDVAVEEIVARVKSFPARHCVLTGGEPLIGRGIHELARQLRGAGLHITIETAATVAPGGIACDLASLSPKLGSSAPAVEEVGAAWTERHESTRWQPAVVREWIAGYAFQLKFVVSDKEDVSEIQGLLAELGGDIPPWKVLLMPEGTDATATGSRRGMLIEVCKRHGFRYSDRLHIEVFGNARGT